MLQGNWFPWNPAHFTLYIEKRDFEEGSAGCTRLREGPGHTETGATSALDGSPPHPFIPSTLGSLTSRRSAGLRVEKLASIVLSF